MPLDPWLFNTKSASTRALTNAAVLDKSGAAAPLRIITTMRDQPSVARGPVIFDSCFNASSATEDAITTSTRSPPCTRALTFGAEEKSISTRAPLALSYLCAISVTPRLTAPALSTFTVADMSAPLSGEARLEIGLLPARQNHPAVDIGQRDALQRLAGADVLHDEAVGIDFHRVAGLDQPADARAGHRPQRATRAVAEEQRAERLRDDGGDAERDNRVMRRRRGATPEVGPGDDEIARLHL